MTRRAFLILFALAALLRLPLLATPLWYDEAFTVTLARLPLSGLLAATAGDVHPPLYYLIVWALYRLWPELPAWAARLPSLAASLACLPLLRLVLKPASPRLQWLGLGLLALSPLHIYYASEARMYALLCLEVLAAFWLVQERRWPWYWLTLVALVYTHNYGLFYAAALTLAALVMWPNDYDRPISASLLTLVCWLPWGLTLTQQMQTIQGSYWMVEPVTLASLISLTYQMVSKGLSSPLAVGTLIAALLIGLWIQRRNTALLVMAFGPLSLATLASLLWQNLLLPRALIGSSPFVLLLLGAALERAWPTRANLRPALIAAIGLVPVFVLGWGALYTDRRVDFGAQAAQVLALARPGETLAFWGTDLQITWSLADQTIAKRAVYVVPCNEIRGGLSQSTRAALGYTARRWSDLHGRIWLVTAESPMVAPCVLAEQRAATQGARLISQVSAPGQLATVTVWLVER